MKLESTVSLSPEYGIKGYSGRGRASPKLARQLAAKTPAPSARVSRENELQTARDDRRLPTMPLGTLELGL